MAWDGSALPGSDPHTRRSDESSGQSSRLNEAPSIPITSQFLPLLDDSQFLPVSTPQNAYEYRQHAIPNSGHYIHNTDLHHPFLNRPTTWHTDSTTIEDVQEPDYRYNSFDRPNHHFIHHQRGFDKGYQIELNGLSNAGARVNTAQHIDNEPMEFTDAIEADYSTLAEGQPVRSHATVQRDTLNLLPTSQLPTNSRIPISRGPPMNIDRDQTSQGTSERRFACDFPQCDVVCKREADLQRHKNCKHGLGNVIYQCDDCTFANARKDKMMDHEKITTHSYQTVNMNQAGAA